MTTPTDLSAACAVVSRARQGHAVVCAQAQRQLIELLSASQEAVVATVNPSSRDDQDALLVGPAAHPLLRAVVAREARHG